MDTSTEAGLERGLIGQLEMEIIGGLHITHTNVQSSKRIIKDKYLTATQSAGI